MIRAHFFKEEEEISKIPVTFYSKAGKKRLVKIWNDKRLSEEFLFSSWASFSSESAMNETVSDYMQSYLQFRLQRFAMTNACHYIYEALQSSNCNKAEEDRKFQNYYSNQKKEELALKERMKMRCVNEEKRVSNMPKELNPVSEILNLNPPNEQVEIKDKTADNNDINDGELSRSSGFFDVTPSPTIRISYSRPSTSVESEDSLFAEFNIEDTFKYLPVNQLSECSNNGETDQLSRILSNEINFQWMSPIVENIFRAKEIPEMYALADRIRRLYKREISCATEFSNNLGQFMSSRVDF